MNKQAVEVVGVLALAAAVVASGVWIVTAEQRSRQLFIEGEALNRELDRLQTDWGRLQIEQSTWAAQPRIESLARGDLSLVPPQQSQVVMLQETRQ